MSDFAHARTNMVDCQIHTAGVIMPALLESFEAIPRERFVPENLQNVAYCDEDLPIGEGRFLIEPITHARMIQALDPKPSDVVLDIGGVTGYSAAVLSSLVTTVIAVEEKKKNIDFGQGVWDELGVCNVAAFKGKLVQGCPNHAPYDLIFINGSVSEIPANIAAQLVPGGKLITIVRKPGDVMGQVTIVHSLGEKGFSSYNLFEAGCPYVPGFEPLPTFTF